MDTDDAFNYSDLEDELDEDEDLRQSSSNAAGGNDETVLESLVQSYDWAAVLGRIKSHPDECRVVSATQGRTPLQVACDNDAPAVVIQALLKAYPEASVLTGDSNMNPLHITCSSQNASVHVVRALLECGRYEQFSMRDMDGDTPLHVACRCGASRDLIEVLLRAYPQAVHVRDYEGLTPLLRLWVRYFVILGEDVIESVKCAADLQGDLLQAWNKTELLLRCAHHGSLHNPYLPTIATTADERLQQPPSQRRFLALHAASAVDCPRSIVKIAARVYPQQLDERDEEGRTPLMIACQAPVFAVRDLSDEGYTLEDVIHGDANVHDLATAENNDVDNPSLYTSTQPSVIEILLQANTAGASQGACKTDPSGRLPLHMALESGKTWNQGVSALIDAFPESLATADQSSLLYPYQLAGSKNDLDCTYELLRRNPTLLQQHRDTTTAGLAATLAPTNCAYAVSQDKDIQTASLSMA